MAKVIITIEDGVGELDGQTQTKFQFDPPINKDSQITGAHRTASVLSECLKLFFDGKLTRVNGQDLPKDE